MILLLPILFLIIASFLFLLSNKFYIQLSISITSSILIFALICFIGTNYKGDLYFNLIEITSGIKIKFEILHYIQIIFALLASFLSIPAGMYAVSYMHHNKERNIAKFLCYFHLSIASTIGIAFSGNLITLFIFYEFLTLLTYPLVTHKKNNESINSGKIYLSFLMLSSLLLFLPAIVWVFNVTKSLDFNLILLNSSFLLKAKIILLLMFIYGIAKAAIFPMHSWLPKAMVAPTPVSALLHAVAVVKSGVFSIIMVLIYVFGIDKTDNQIISDVLIYISGFTVIFGSLIALSKKDLKAMLAYSTVSQLSCIVMIASILTKNSIKAATFYMVMHGFAKITLFFTVGAIYLATGKKSITEIDGIGKKMPTALICFTIGALSMVGLPPTAGFFAKLHALSSANEVKNYFIIFVMLTSTILNALYFLPIIIKGFFFEQKFTLKKEGNFVKIPYLITAIGTITLTFAAFYI